MKTSDFLREAKQKLIDVGWCQHTNAKIMYGKPVAYCMNGAVDAVWHERIVNAKSATDIYAGNMTLTRATTLLNSALPEEYPDGTPVFSRSGWNDAYGRSKDEVLAVFDAAIKLAEAEEKQ